MLQLLTDIQFGNNMSKFNSTSHQKYIFTEQNLQILQIFTFVCGISTTFLVYFVKKYMTGLDILIKSIFYFELGKNIISHIIGFICLHLMSFWKIQNLATCILTMSAYTLGYFGTTISISMISNIRLYLSVKQSLNETYQKKDIQFKIFAIYVIGIGISAYNIIFSALKGSFSPINFCAGIPPYPLTFNILVNMGLVTYFILMVFVGDFIMLVYRWRKTKEIVPVELVAPNSEYMTVPVHATLLSILLILIITFGRNYLFLEIANLDLKHPHVNYYFLACGIIVMVYSLIPCFIIYKTVKTKKYYSNAPCELRRQDKKESQDNKQNHRETNPKVERNSNNENVDIMQGLDSKQLIKHQQHTKEDNTYSIQEEVEFNTIKEHVELNAMEENIHNEPSLGQTTPNIISDLTKKHMNKNMNDPQETVDNFEDTKANNSNDPKEDFKQNVIVVDVHNEQNLKNTTTKRVRDLTKIDTNISQEQNWDKIEVVSDSDE